MATARAIFSGALPLGLALTITLIGTGSRSTEGPSKSDETTFSKQIQPFLKQHCFGCHGEKRQSGKLRLDILPPSFRSRQGEIWNHVRERLRLGEMPPESRPRPGKEELSRVVEWIEEQSLLAEKARQTQEGRVVLRRLNRTEYENTIRDLLAIEADLKDHLPEDSSAYGFDNNAEALNLSTVLMERYLQTADLALDEAIVREARPQTIRRRYSYKDEKRVTGNKKIFKEVEDAMVFFSSRYSPTALSRFRAPAKGHYRLRVSAYAYQSERPVTLSIYAGNVIAREGKKHLVGYYDVKPQPTIIEFEDHFQRGDSIRIVPFRTGGQIYQIGAEKYKGPGLAVQWVEIEGPIHKTWPPESHSRLFGSLDFQKGTLQDAEQILLQFMPRAFRRPVHDEEIKPYLALVQASLKNGQTFEEAIRVGFKAVLCSPGFLYFKEKPGKLDDYALASRLSYFLWSSLPDEALLKLAEQKKLSDPAVLRQQVERMLTDSRSSAITDHFLGQWLELREIDFTTPDGKLYPEHDELLQVSMVQETELFFEEILKNDLSLLNFIDSDFAILNERLAEHYEIPDVQGQKFRKVALPKGSHRGGVMTHASVLKVTANGTNTSPVLRGVWILDRILGQPVPPPPANVPAVEPDIRGAITIREQLAKHRQVASCASCHRKIDPLGFALENYDVIGGWREHYRSLGKGERVDKRIQGRRPQYRKGLPVDAGDTLPNGKTFRNLEELKVLLLMDKDQIARSLTEKLLIYSTGAGLHFSNRPEIDRIVESVRRKNYGLRSLIHEIVQSDLFLKK